MEERNCAFQYAKISHGFFRSTELVCDKTELTIDEAKKLFTEYYNDCAKWIASGNSAEMVIWVNMHTPTSYGDVLQYISTDAESDGITIWQNVRLNFVKY